MAAGSSRASRSRRPKDRLSRGWTGIIGGSLFSMLIVFASLMAGSEPPRPGDDVAVVATSVMEIAAGRYRPGAAVRFPAVLLPHTVVRVEDPGRRHLALAVEPGCGLFEGLSGLRDDLRAFRARRFPLPADAVEDDEAPGAAETELEAIDDRADELLGAGLDARTPVAIRVDRLDPSVARLELRAFVVTEGREWPSAIDAEAIERDALARALRHLAATGDGEENTDPASRWNRIEEDASCLEVGRAPVVLGDVEVGRVLELGLSREGCAPRTTIRTAPASADGVVRFEVALDPAR